MPRIETFAGGFEVQGRESGEPVVLLHASGSSYAQWRALIERLSPRYRVVAPDLYGYGACANWPGRGAFCLGCEAAVVCALLDRLDGPAHLVGHSYGGAVALHVARERGDRLRSLTLIEPVAFHLLRAGDATDAAALREISAVADAMVRALACGDYAGGFGRFIDYWSGPGTWESIPAAKRDSLAARLGKVALDFHATLNEPTRLEDFGALAVATLVVQGARSPLPPRRICERLAAVLPRAQSITIEGAGHMAPLTHRDEVNALVAAHLESNSGNEARCPALRKTVSGTGTPSAVAGVA